RLKRLASLRREREYVVRSAAGRLLPFVLDRRAAEVRPPPEVCIAVGGVDGERQCVAAALDVHGAGRVLVPSLLAVVAAGAAGGSQRVVVHIAPIGKIADRSIGPGEALAGEFGLDLQCRLAVPGIAACRGLVGTQDGGGIGGRERGTCCDTQQESQSDCGPSFHGRRSAAGDG